MARSLSGSLPDYAVDTIGDFLAEAEAAFRRRNALVHSSFPAQPDGRIWGHRPSRDKGVIDGTADTVETTLEGLRAFIVRLADIIWRFNDVHSLAELRRET